MNTSASTAAIYGEKRNARNLFKGYQAAILTQVPYTVILLGTFEYLDSTIFSDNMQMRFNKFDDYSFAVKFLQRFGSSTLSLLIA